MSVEDKLKHFRPMEYLSDTTSDSIHEGSVKTHEYFTFLRHYIKNGVLEGGDATTTGRQIHFSTPIRGLINGQFVLFDSTTYYQPTVTDGTRWLWIYPKPGSVYRSEIRCTNRKPDDSTGLILWSIDIDDRGWIDEVIDERLVLPALGFRERRWIGWYPTLDDLPRWGFQDGDVAVVGINIYVYEESDNVIGSTTGSFWVPWTTRKGVKRAYKYWRLEEDDVVITADSTSDTITFVEGDHIIFDVGPNDDATISVLINTDLQMNSHKVHNVRIKDMTGTLNVSGDLRVSSGLKLGLHSDFEKTLAQLIVFNSPADILQSDGTSVTRALNMREGNIDGTYLEVLLNTDITGALTINNKLFGRQDIITNGSFETGPLSNWTLWTGPTADATAMMVSLHGIGDAPDETHWSLIHISAKGSAASHIQFYQKDIDIRTGRRYVLQYYARAFAARSIQVHMIYDHDPYYTLGLAQTQSITTSWVEYSHSFKSTEDSTNGRVDFYLGNSLSDVEIDHVRLYRIDEITPATHARRHEHNGEDEISIEDLKGLLKEPQKISQIHGHPVADTIPTKNQILRFVGCTCYNLCYGYSACSCDSACNVDLCDQCDAACYGYVACTCNSSCYSDACDRCNASCYGYSACSCNNTCYQEGKTPPCSCNLTCYGYSACTCNSTCYSDLCDTCNASCYGYTACTCNSSCHSDACDQCDASCYGHSACSCDVTTHGSSNKWYPVDPP